MSGRERLKHAGKGAAVAGGVAGLGVLHMVFDVTWAAASVVSVLACVLGVGGGLLVGRRRKRRRKRSKVLRMTRRARLWRFRRRQARQRRGAGTWGQRVAFQERRRR